MAEGFTRQMLGEIIEPYSAGIKKSRLDPRAVTVMQEADIDISQQHSKTLADLEGTPFDFAITVCADADAQCPSLPGETTVLHMHFDDPPGLAADAEDDVAALAHYRRVRDEIREFVETIPEKLQSAGD
jgi:arsenate reductase